MPLQPEKKGKSVWRGRGGDEVSVEIFALQYYEEQGYQGCEHLIISPEHLLKQIAQLPL